MREQTLTLVTDLSDSIGKGERIVTIDIGQNGEALMFVVNTTDAEMATSREIQPGWASFAMTKSPRRYDASVVIHDGRSARRIELRDVDITFPSVQLLRRDELLVVGARCRRYSDGTFDLNGHVFDLAGQPRRQMLLGDGINSVQTSADGRIWVSYGDEGIYGNFGWGAQHNSEPIGSAGLVRFDEFGHVEWKYEPPSDVEPMDDCYALNVTPTAVWACYYSAFPLVRIAANDDIDTWNSPIAGAHGLSIDEDRVLFCGGYEGRETCSLCVIRSDRLSLVDSFALALPDTAANPHIRARGPAVHVFVGTIWYRLDLRGAGPSRS
jgi:hypothetical protein